MAEPVLPESIVDGQPNHEPHHEALHAWHNQWINPASGDMFVPDDFGGSAAIGATGPTGPSGPTGPAASSGIIVDVTDHGVVATTTTVGAANTTALNTLIASVPAHSDICFPPGDFYFASAIELLNPVALIGPSSPTATRLLCSTGYTDRQLIRNWTAANYQTPSTRTVSVTNGSNVVTDAGCVSGDAAKNIVPGQGFPPGATVGTVTAGVSYTVILGPGGNAANWLGATGSVSLTIGENDAFYAPLNIPNPKNNYMVVKNLSLSCNGGSNITLLARAQQHERAQVDTVMYLQGGGAAGTNNVGRADFGPTIGQYRCSGEVQYGNGWKHMILVDGLNGNKMAETASFAHVDGMTLSDVTTSPQGSSGVAYSASAFRFRALSWVAIRDVHTEGFPPATDTTVFTDGVTSATTTISSFQFAASLNAGNMVGRTVTDSAGDIPAGTTVVSYSPLAPTQLVLSAAATGSHTANTFTFGSDVALFRFIDVDFWHLADSEADFSTGATTARSCRLVRNTTSGLSNVWNASGKGKITDVRLASTGIGTGGGKWVDQTPIIEDLGVGAARIYKADAVAFDPRYIYYYDGTTFSYANTAAMTPVTLAYYPDGTYQVNGGGRFGPLASRPAATSLTAGALWVDIEPAATIALVQDDVAAGALDNSSSATLTVTFTKTTTVGNHLLLACGAAAQKVLTGIVDSRGNTWQIDQVKAAQGSGTLALSPAIASCRITVAHQIGDTLTLTFSGASLYSVGIVSEWSGMAASGWLDLTINANGLSTDGQATTPLMALRNQPAELVVGVVGYDSATSMVAYSGSTGNGLGMSNLTVKSSGAGNRKVSPIYKRVSVPGIDVVRWDLLATPVDWADVAVTYKASWALPVLSMSDGARWTNV